MRTGELAAASGLTAKTIRFYKQTGLLPEPPRTPSGYRDYPLQMTHRLAFIRDAQSAGLTLAEIRSVLALRDSGEPPCTHVTDLIEQHLADIELCMAELRKTCTALRGLAERAAVTDPSTWHTGGHLPHHRRPRTRVTTRDCQLLADNLRLSA